MKTEIELLEKEIELQKREIALLKREAIPFSVPYIPSTVWPPLVVEPSRTGLPSHIGDPPSLLPNTSYPPTIIWAAPNYLF